MAVDIDVETSENEIKLKIPFLSGTSPILSALRPHVSSGSQTGQRRLGRSLQGRRGSGGKGGLRTAPGPSQRLACACPRPLPASSSGSSPASLAAPTSTPCRTMTGKPFPRGSTASACAGFLWCPLCSTRSPGRRATSGTRCPARGRGHMLCGAGAPGPRDKAGLRVCLRRLHQQRGFTEHVLSCPCLVPTHSVLPAAL